MNAPFKKDRQSAPVRRILALWFPYLPTERILRQRLGVSWRSRERHETRGRGAPGRPPLVVSHRDNNAQRIAAFDEKGEALSLRRGMGIADARAMHPTIEIIEADPEADRRLLSSLADWCDRYTPLVALDGEDGLFLDVTGCTNLFGGEQAMFGDLLHRLSGQGFDARAGLASTPGMAWAAARFLNSSVIAPGAEAGALAALPLAALRLDSGARMGLESVGLRTVGSILSLPRAPLARRFGKNLLLRLDQALGVVEEAVSPRLPVAPLSVERRLVEPVIATEDVERLVLLLGRSLKFDLEQRGEGARLLQLTLFRVDGAVFRHAVGATRPLREPVLMQKLFKERLATSKSEIDPGCGFELVRLSVLETAPFEIGQTDLTGGGRKECDSADLALFTDRISARLGEEALMRPVSVESHRPERAIMLTPLARMPLAASAEGQVPPGPETSFERPIRLLARPEPIDVTAVEVPEGPPVNFRWRRALHRVARSEGPERIAPEWWLETRGAPTRDYFRIEDEAGRRFWLYRQGLYGASQEMPRWYMHGLFA